jgi:hypothetical protein
MRRQQDHREQAHKRDLSGDAAYQRTHQHNADDDSKVVFPKIERTGDDRPRRSVEALLVQAPPQLHRIAAARILRAHALLHPLEELVAMLCGDMLLPETHHLGNRPELAADRATRITLRRDHPKLSVGLPLGERLVPDQRRIGDDAAPNQFVKLRRGHRPHPLPVHRIMKGNRLFAHRRIKKENAPPSLGRQLNPSVFEISTALFPGSICLPATFGINRIVPLRASMPILERLHSIDADFRAWLAAASFPREVGPDLLREAVLAYPSRNAKRMRPALTLLAAAATGGEAAIDRAGTSPGRSSSSIPGRSSMMTSSTATPCDAASPRSTPSPPPGPTAL